MTPLELKAKALLGLGDVIMGILGLFEEEKEEEFLWVAATEAFSALSKEAELCQQTRVERILSDLYFSYKRGGYKYCSKLEELFFQMGTSGLLVHNQWINGFVISPKAKKAIREDLENLFSAEEVDELRGLAARLRKKSLNLN